MAIYEKMNNPKNQSLCEKIAQLWVENGGDDYGFDYCYRYIRSAIRELYAAQKISSIIDEEKKPC